MFYTESDIAQLDYARRMASVGGQLIRQYKKMLEELDSFDAEMRAFSWTGRFAVDVRAELTVERLNLRSDNSDLVVPINEKLGHHRTWVLNERERLRRVEDTKRKELASAAATTGLQYRDLPPSFSWKWDAVSTDLGQ